MGVKLKEIIVVLASLFLAISMDATADLQEDIRLAERALDRQDLTDAANYLRSAAEQNHIPSQTKLGELLRSAQDDEAAVGWFIMAAFQGDADAAFDLGQMYSLGQGVEKSNIKAAYWTKFAAKKNHFEATRAIALAYRKGHMGLEIDIEQAKKWEAKIPALEAAKQKEIKANNEAIQEALKKAAKEAAEKRKAVLEKAKEDASK